MSRIKELESLINNANHAYYNSDEPLMSDAEFDALRDELVQLNPKSKVLAKVGAPVAVSVWPKVEHIIPMGSQLKINTRAELDSWFDKYTSGEVIWSEKLDGSSVELIYDGGKLVQAITRGDGEIGEDITPNVLRMQVPKEIKEKGRVSIRGEIIIHISVWKQNFSGDKNPRNTAAGIARRKHNNTDCEHLVVMCYDVVGVEFDTNGQLMRWLMSQGLTVPMWGECVSAEEVQEVHNSYSSWTRATLDYEIDGLVIREKDRRAELQCGIVDGRPRAQRAYKFESIGGTTVLLGVTWQAGRTGVITPVAEIEPISIGGVTISRVNLDNPDQVKKLGIRCGSSLHLIRANDVIPKVVGADGGSDDIAIPSVCPACGGPTKFDGVKLWCRSDECPAKTLKRINYFLKYLDIKGFGKKTIDKLVETGKVNTLADLYTLSVADIAGLEGLGEKVAVKVLQQLHSKKELDLPTFIAAIGIPGVSHSFTSLIYERFPSIEAMKEASVAELCDIKGVGDSIAEALQHGLAAFAPIIEGLLQHITIIAPQEQAAPASGDLEGQSFCFTGFRNDIMEQKIKDRGGKIASGVSKKLTCLVCADRNSGSSKNKKAAELGIKIMEEQELWEILTTDK